MRPSWAEQAVAPRQARRTFPVECVESEIEAVVEDKRSIGLALVRRETRAGRSGPVVLLWFEAVGPEVEYR